MKSLKRDGIFLPSVCGGDTIFYGRRMNGLPFPLKMV